MSVSWREDGSIVNEYQGYNSITPEVAAMGHVNLGPFTMIPDTWWKTIVIKTSKRKDKPDTNAIHILSSLVYWAKPKVVRNPQTGEVTGYRKRFEGDKMQVSYAELGAKFGLPKRDVKAACDRLIEMGLITREFRTVRTDRGQMLYNVIFFGLNVPAIDAITNPVVACDGAPIEAKHGGTKNCKTPPGGYKKLYPQMPPRGTKNCRTYTNTIKESTKNKEQVLKNKLNKTKLGHPKKSIEKKQLGSTKAKRSYDQLHEKVSEAENHIFENVTKDVAEIAWDKLVDRYDRVAPGALKPEYMHDQKVLALVAFDKVAGELQKRHFAPTRICDYVTTLTPNKKTQPSFLIRDSLKHIDDYIRAMPDGDISWSRI